MKSARILFLILLPALAWGAMMTESKDLVLSAAGIDTLVIHCGAGSLKLQGTSGSGTIQISARLEVENFSEGDFRKLIQDNVQLSLQKLGNQAILKSEVKPPAGTNIEVRINLEVELPETINVDITDGSGSINVNNLHSSLKIDDDTGSIKISDISGEVRIADSSGSIEIEEITGNVFVTDGSGSISIESVRGNLIVNDGSGSITIVEIDGNVTVSDGSGSIDIQDVKKNVFIVIREEGSGIMEVEGVKGKVTIRP